MEMPAGAAASESFFPSSSRRALRVDMFSVPILGIKYIPKGNRCQTICPLLLGTYWNK